MSIRPTTRVVCGKILAGNDGHCHCQLVFYCTLPYVAMEFFVCNFSQFYVSCSHAFFLSTFVRQLSNFCVALCHCKYCFSSHMGDQSHTTQSLWSVLETYVGLFVSSLSNYCHLLLSVFFRLISLCVADVNFASFQSNFVEHCWWTVGLLTSEASA